MCVCLWVRGGGGLRTVIHTSSHRTRQQSLLSPSEHPGGSGTRVQLVLEAAQSKLGQSSAAVLRNFGRAAKLGW